MACKTTRPTSVSDVSLADESIANEDFAAGTLAREPASSRGADFNAQSASELNAFHTDLLGFQGLLSDMGQDKGLANYDSSNSLETLLKDMVNSVKYMLNDVDDLVYQLPGVGPTLGPSASSSLSFMCARVLTI